MSLKSPVFWIEMAVIFFILDTEKTRFKYPQISFLKLFQKN